MHDPLGKLVVAWQMTRKKIPCVGEASDKLYRAGRMEGKGLERGQKIGVLFLGVKGEP
jgi:hypothetical protein